MRKVWEKEFQQRKHLRQLSDPLVKRYLSESNEGPLKRVLDLGCGGGRHIVCLAKRHLVIGLDWASASLRLADHQLRHRRIRNYVLVQHDFKSLPFPDSHFDAVIAIDAIDHQRLHQIRKTLREIWRVLTKGGLFIATLKSISDPWFRKGRKIESNTFLYKRKIHHFFSAVELKKLLVNFELVHLRQRILRKGTETMVKWEVVAQKPL